MRSYSVITFLFTGLLALLAPVFALADVSFFSSRVADSPQVVLIVERAQNPSGYQGKVFVLRSESYGGGNSCPVQSMCYPPLLPVGVSWDPPACCAVPGPQARSVPSSGDFFTFPVQFQNGLFTDTLTGNILRASVALQADPLPLSPNCAVFLNVGVVSGNFTTSYCSIR